MCEWVSEWVHATFGHIWASISCDLVACVPWHTCLNAHVKCLCWSYQTQVAWLHDLSSRDCERMKIFCGMLTKAQFREVLCGASAIASPQHLAQLELVSFLLPIVDRRKNPWSNWKCYCLIGIWQRNGCAMPAGGTTSWAKCWGSSCSNGTHVSLNL